MKYLRKFNSVQEMNNVMTDNWTGVLGMVDNSGSVSVKNHVFVPQPNDEIWYTSSDGNVVTPYSVVFGSGITVVSNTYSGGKGIIKLSGNATTIGDYAFQDCTRLTLITIPSSVTSIGHHTFIGCSGLTSITIPNNVTSIGRFVFDSCIKLTTITIPSSVTSIGYGPLSGCTNLTSIVVDSNNQYYDSRNNCNAIIETATNKFIQGCMNTIIPDNVTSINKYAFQNCGRLASITIPSGVTSIGECAFEGCTNLTSIVVDSNNQYYDSRNNCNAIIETATNKLIQGCMNTIIPDSVTSIGDEAFSCYSTLTSIDIPNSVTSIGDFAFYECYGLTSITIGNGVTSIGQQAFSKCTGLLSLTIPNGVTSINYGTINKCDKLTTFTIPSSVTNINDYAFFNSTGLTSIICEPTNPPVLSNANAFTNTNDCIIYVPAGSVDAYKAANNWSSLASRIQAIQE